MCWWQRDYWAKQLKDAPYVPNIPMPSDFDRPITDDSLGEEIKVSVAADLVKSLKSLAIACGTTLFVTVLGAWKVCMKLQAEPATESAVIIPWLCWCRVLHECLMHSHCRRIFCLLVPTQIQTL